MQTNRYPIGALDSRYLNAPSSVYLPIALGEFAPAPDGSSNAVTAILAYDGTNYREYIQFTGLADTQDLDMVWEGRLPDNYSAFLGSNSFSIDVRASDYANCQMLLTLRDASGNADATISSYDITPTANNTWQTKTVEPGSTYTAGEGIIVRVRVVSLDTSDTASFARVKIGLTLS